MKTYKGFITELPTDFISIEGYEDLYSINIKGEILSHPKINGQRGLSQPKILKHLTDSDGYKFIALSKDGNKKYYKIHRLIAQSFIINPLNKPIINHKNGIKDDNRISNLEWCTTKENIQHSWDMGLSNQDGEKNPTSKLTEAIVKDIRNRIKNGEVQRKVAIELNISPTTVHDIINFKTWKHI